ncbi:MAG: galactose mutarotase [Clostridia bacterium]|nr:galactose mutarotase [Clostridia bacterium]
MSIEKKSFGFVNNKEVFLYTLDNGKNLRAEIINYGGIIKNLWVKDLQGNFIDVVLGRDTIEEYLDNDGYFGAAIGRYANRIYKGKFNIGDESYSIGINDGENSLHGGEVGFDKYIWNVVELDEAEPALVLEIVSPDNDEGFPGTLEIKMTYKLTNNDGLVISYEAKSDKDTIVNLTNHSYFNLNGAGEDNIYNHLMSMNCDFYTPNSSECMPYGEILSVKNTPFDFTSEKLIGEDINSDYEQIKMCGGYDHNFIINGTGFREAAQVKSTRTGITMKVFTDKPGVQLYTGNCIDESRVCKSGVKYNKHGALCLETQHFPNSTSFAHFPSPVLKAGEIYSFKTEYRFSNN